MTAATSTPTGATISIGGGAPIRVLSARLLTPWKGAWLADLDLDPDDPSSVPTSGSAVLTIGATTLTGTIDPAACGRFVAGFLLRLVAGGDGWDTTCDAQDFSNDGGVLSSSVEQSTAGLVGETVVDSAPISLGMKWVRAAGPASRVFEDPDRDWYVDFSGVTQVASRPAATADASLQILTYDPVTGRVEVACDVPILPGTTLTDDRFDGTLTVRKVEQTFSREGARATLWCSSAPVDPLLVALVSMVRELGGVATLRVIPYRYVSASAKRLNLQAVDKPQGQPDLQNVPVFGGMPGDSAKLANSTNVLVLFVEGKKGAPVAFAFDGTVPLERTVDATSALHLGPSAANADICGGSDFVALASMVKGELTKIAAAFTSFIPGSGGASFSDPYTTAGDVAAQKVKAT